MGLLLSYWICLPVIHIDLDFSTNTCTKFAWLRNLDEMNIIKEQSIRLLNLFCNECERYVCQDNANFMQLQASIKATWNVQYSDQVSILAMFFLSHGRAEKAPLHSRLISWLLISPYFLHPNIQTYGYVWEVKIFQPDVAKGLLAQCFYLVMLVLPDILCRCAIALLMPLFNKMPKCALVESLKRGKMERNFFSWFISFSLWCIVGQRTRLYWLYVCTTNWI